MNGASHKFVDQHATKGPLSAENLNSLDMGGNVSPNAGGGLLVDISPIRGLINNSEINYAGTTGLALTGSATVRIWIDSAGVLQTSTSAFPTYPSTKFFPLAEVATSGSGITTITDRRWKFFA